MYGSFRFDRQSTSILCALAALGFVSTLGPIAVSQAQDIIQKAAPVAAATTRLSVGDVAPPLKVEKFIKGSAIESFESGRIYVVEFWATWCGPCIRGMPHISEVQQKYKDKATIIGVNIWEDREYSEQTLSKVEAFVKDKDEIMGYTIAFDGPSKTMDMSYMKAAEKNGIPCAFVVGGDGKIAYIGHPMDEGFEGTIRSLIDGTFKADEAKSNYEKALAAEQEMMVKQRAMSKLMAEAQKDFEAGKIDDGLAKMDEVIKLDPSRAPAIEVRKVRMLMDNKQVDRSRTLAQAMMDGPAKDDGPLLNMLAGALMGSAAGSTSPNLDLALAAATRSNELSANKDAASIDTLARIMQKKGEHAKGIELMTKAVELSEGRLKEARQKALDDMKAVAVEAAKSEGK